MRILTRRLEEALGHLLAEKDDTIYGQALLLQASKKEIRHLRTMLLFTFRATRDLADGFRMIQEDDMDMSEELEELITDLSDRICQLEEHHVM